MSSDTNSGINKGSDKNKCKSNNHDDFDENKWDFELLNRRLSSAPATTREGSTNNPNNNDDTPPASSERSRPCHVLSKNDMIWPLSLTPTFIGYYIIGDVIGNGSYAEVRECVDTRTLERCALKSVNKSYLVRKAPRALANQLQEIRLLRHLEHPNVIRMRECLFKDDRIHIVLEYCSFNLDELLNDQPGGSLNATVAHSFFLQLCSAVAYLHAMGIVHRDVKPQNLLLTNEGKLKLIDFGVSHVLSMWDQRDLCSNYEGSPLFQAPEVISGQREYNGFKVDIWSCGVTLYLMLFGHYPFMDEALLGLYDKILGQDLCVPEHQGFGSSSNSTSMALRDLLAMMLEKDSAKRGTIEQVIEHPWCRLVVNDYDDLEFSHSEFFDLVMQRRNERRLGKGSATLYATSQRKDMYKSMSCLPYLYQHHHPHLPIHKKSTPDDEGRGIGSTKQTCIIERVNLMCSSNSSGSAPPSSAFGHSRSASSSSSTATTADESTTSEDCARRCTSTSESSGVTSEAEGGGGRGSDDEDATSGQVEWGTREQYHLMKVPQVRANRVRSERDLSKTRGRKRRSKRAGGNDEED